MKKNNKTIINDKQINEKKCFNRVIVYELIKYYKLPR